jgi:hypothetical protein
MPKRVGDLETFDDCQPLPALPIASLWLARGEDASFHFRAGKQEESSPSLRVLRRSI